MKNYVCYKCGLPIVFRAHATNRHSGQVVRPTCGKAIPIHIGGTCGQTFMPFLLSA